MAIADGTRLLQKRVPIPLALRQRRAYCTAGGWREPDEVSVEAEPGRYKPRDRDFENNWLPIVVWFVAIPFRHMLGVVDRNLDLVRKTKIAAGIRPALRPTRLKTIAKHL